MQTIDKFNFAGKKAFVRVDFNVPLDENFNITDDTRMRAALPTLKKILADGGSIIIGSHLGRPKGVADKFSLKHIIKHLSELLGVEVQFANDCMGEEANFLVNSFWLSFTAFLAAAFSSSVASSAKPLGLPSSSA